MATQKHDAEVDARSHIIPEVTDANGSGLRQIGPGVEAGEHRTQRRAGRRTRWLEMSCALLAAALVVPSSAVAQFPRQALGYAFDAPPDAVCLAARGAWALDRTGDYGRCTVAPTGQSGHTAVTFCNDGLPCTVSFGTSGASAVAAAWRDLVVPVVEQFGGDYGRRVDSCIRAFIDDPSSSRARCRTGTQGGAAAIRIGGGMFFARLYLSLNPARSHLTVTYISPRNSSDFRTAGGASSDSVALRSSTRALPWGFTP